MKLEIVTRNPDSPKQELPSLERAKSNLINPSNTARIQKIYAVEPLAHVEKLARTSEGSFGKFLKGFAAGKN